MDRIKRPIKTPIRFENYEAPNSRRKILKVKLSARSKSLGSAETSTPSTTPTTATTSTAPTTTATNTTLTPLCTTSTSKSPTPASTSSTSSSPLGPNNASNSITTLNTPVKISTAPSLTTTPSIPAPVDNVRKISESSRTHKPIKLVMRPKVTLTPNANETPNISLPFWDAKTAAEIHEDDNVKELVHCRCGIEQESGLMVQCETCLTWQHALCLGLKDTDEEVPDGYTCEACSDPRDARESMRYNHDQEWLTKGKLKRFLCNQSNIPQESINRLKKTNELIERVIMLKKLIHSYLIKAKILEGDDFTKLKLFRNSWSDFNQPLEAYDIRQNDVSKDLLEKCRKNLREHLHDIEEHIKKASEQIEVEVGLLEETRATDIKAPSLESLKSDLLCIKGIVDQNLR